MQVAAEGVRAERLELAPTSPAGRARRGGQRRVRRRGSGGARTARRRSVSDEHDVVRGAAGRIGEVDMPARRDRHVRRPARVGLEGIVGCDDRERRRRLARRRSGDQERSCEHGGRDIRGSATSHLPGDDGECDAKRQAARPAGRRRRRGGRRALPPGARLKVGAHTPGPGERTGRAGVPLPVDAGEHPPAVDGLAADAPPLQPAARRAELRAAVELPFCEPVGERRDVNTLATLARRSPAQGGDCLRWRAGAPSRGAQPGRGLRFGADARIDSGRGEQQQRPDHCHAPPHRVSHRHTDCTPCWFQPSRQQDAVDTSAERGGSNPGHPLTAT